MNSQVIFFKDFIYFYFMFMNVLPECISVHNVFVLSAEATENIGSPGTRATGGCEQPCRWEFNLDLLEEQTFLLPNVQSLQS